MIVLTVGLAHQMTLASLIPRFPLSDQEAEELASFLPEIIKNFVDERRLGRGLEAWAL